MPPSTKSHNIAPQNGNPQFHAKHCTRHMIAVRHRIPLSKGQTNRERCCSSLKLPQGALVRRPRIAAFRCESTGVGSQRKRALKFRCGAGYLWLLEVRVATLCTQLNRTASVYEECKASDKIKLLPKMSRVKGGFEVTSKYLLEVFEALPGKVTGVK